MQLLYDEISRIVTLVASWNTSIHKEVVKQNSAGHCRTQIYTFETSRIKILVYI